MQNIQDEFLNFQSLKHELDIKQNEINDKEKTIFGLNEQINSLSKEKKQSEINFVSVREEFKKYQAQNEPAINDLFEKDRQINQLKYQLEDLTKEKMANDKKLIAVQEEIRFYQTSKFELEIKQKELSEKEKTIVDLREQLSNLSKRDIPIVNVNDSIKYEKQIFELRSQNDSLRSEKSTVENRLLTLRDEFNKLDVVKRELDAKENVIIELRDQLNNFTKEKGSIENRLKASQDELKRLKDSKQNERETNELKFQIERLTNEKLAIETELKSVQENLKTLDTIKKELSHKEKVIEELTAELDAIADEKYTVEKRFFDLQEAQKNPFNPDSGKKELKEKEKIINELKIRLEDVIIEKKSVENKLNVEKLKSSSEYDFKSKSDLKYQLNSAMHEKNVLETTLTNLKEELKQYKNLDIETTFPVGSRLDVTLVNNDVIEKDRIIEELSNKLYLVTNERNEIEANLIAVQEELRSYQISDSFHLGTRRIEVPDTENRLFTLNNQLNDLNDQKKLFERKFHSLQEENKSLQSNLQRYEQNESESFSKINELNERLNFVSFTNSKLEQDAKNMEKESKFALVNFNQQLDVIMNEKISLENQINVLRTQITATHNEKTQKYLKYEENIRNLNVIIDTSKVIHR